MTRDGGNCLQSSPNDLLISQENGPANGLHDIPSTPRYSTVRQLQTSLSPLTNPRRAACDTKSSKATGHACIEADGPRDILGPWGCHISNRGCVTWGRYFPGRSDSSWLLWWKRIGQHNNDNQHNSRSAPNALSTFPDMSFGMCVNPEAYPCQLRISWTASRLRS